MLDQTESILVSAIFQDMIDRLHVVGRLLPVPVAGARLNHTVFTDDSAQAATNFRTKESLHELFPKNLKNKFRSKETANDDIIKLQKDRTTLEDILQKTLLEIRGHNSYGILVEAVDVDTTKKADYTVVIKREQVLNHRISVLEKLLNKSVQERDSMVKKCIDTATNLSDHLREAKIRMALEENYVLNQSNANIYQAKKRFRTMEQDIISSMEKLKDNFSREDQITKSFEKFVRHSLDLLDQKMEYWMDKHETETEAIEKEIEGVIASKQYIINRQKSLVNLMGKYKKELDIDQKRKERKRKLNEDEEESVIAATRVQAWWRGEMVRHFKGNYKGLKKMMLEKKAVLKKK